MRDARLDCVRRGSRFRSQTPGSTPRAVVRLDHAHVRAGGESLDERPGRPAQRSRSPPSAAGTTRSANRAAPGSAPGSAGVPSECAVDQPAAGVLVSNRVRRAQVCLVLEVDDERGFLSAGRVAQDASVDLALVLRQRSHRPRARSRRPRRRARRRSDSAGHEPSLQDQEHCLTSRPQGKALAPKSKIAAYNGRAPS